MYNNAPKILQIKFEIPPKFRTAIAVEIVNDAVSTKDWVAAGPAAIVQVGENIPCLNKEDEVKRTTSSYNHHDDYG